MLSRAHVPQPQVVDRAWTWDRRTEPLPPPIRNLRGTVYSSGPYLQQLRQVFPCIASQAMSTPWTPSIHHIPYIYIYLCVYIYISHIYKCVYRYMRERYKHTCTYIYRYMYTHIYIYIYVYMYTSSIDISDPHPHQEEEGPARPPLCQWQSSRRRRPRLPRLATRMRCPSRLRALSRVHK